MQFQASFRAAVSVQHPRIKLWHAGVFSAFALVATLAAVDTADAAQKSLTFCNKNAEKLAVAIGYDRAGTSETTSSGWHQVAPCSCREIFNTDLRGTDVFYMVVRPGSLNPLTSGKGPLCIKSAGFRHLGENASAASCQKAGGKWVNFQHQDITGTGKANFNLNFNVQGGKPCNL